MPYSRVARATGASGRDHSGLAGSTAALAALPDGPTIFDFPCLLAYRPDGRFWGPLMPTLCDLIVIGGGLVGGAIAWGAQARGADVVLLDEGDIAYRATRGNFGLVWVQSKGVGMPPYAQW